MSLAEKPPRNRKRGYLLLADPAAKNLGGRGLLGGAWDLSSSRVVLHHWPCLKCIEMPMTESAVALGSITEREGGGGGGQADLQTARAFFCMFEGP